MVISKNSLRIPTTFRWLLEIFVTKYWVFSWYQSCLHSLKVFFWQNWLEFFKNRQKKPPWSTWVDTYIWAVLDPANPLDEWHQFLDKVWSVPVGLCDGEPTWLKLVRKGSQRGRNRNSVHRTIRKHGTWKKVCVRNTLLVKYVIMIKLCKSAASCISLPR